MEGGKQKYIGSDIQDGPETEGIISVANLEDLRTVWPELFRQ